MRNFHGRLCNDPRSAHTRYQMVKMQGVMPIAIGALCMCGSSRLSSIRKHLPDRDLSSRTRYLRCSDCGQVYTIADAREGFR